MIDSSRLASRQLCPICTAGSKVATAMPAALPTSTSGFVTGSPGRKTAR